MPDVLEVGDVMRWSSALVEQLQLGEQDILVRVTAIVRRDDGTVQLYLEQAEIADSEVVQ